MSISINIPTAASAGLVGLLTAMSFLYGLIRDAQTPSSKKLLFVTYNNRYINTLFVVMAVLLLGLFNETALLVKNANLLFSGYFIILGVLIGHGIRLSHKLKVEAPDIIMQQCLSLAKKAEGYLLLQSCEGEPRHQFLKIINKLKIGLSNLLESSIDLKLNHLWESLPTYSLYVYERNLMAILIASKHITQFTAHQLLATKLYQLLIKADDDQLQLVARLFRHCLLHYSQTSETKSDTQSFLDNSEFKPYFNEEVRYELIKLFVDCIKWLYLDNRIEKANQVFSTLFGAEPPSPHTAHFFNNAEIYAKTTVSFLSDEYFKYAQYPIIKKYHVKVLKAFETWVAECVRFATPFNHEKQEFEICTKATELLDLRISKKQLSYRLSTVLAKFKQHADSFK